MTRVTRDDDGILQEIHNVTTLSMEGHIASDGSCSGGEICQVLARSGWGVVQVEHGTGKIEKAIYGAVWEPFPQNSQAGEWLAAAAAVQAAEQGSSTLDIDCQAVLNGLAKLGGLGWLSHRCLGWSQEEHHA